MKRLALTVLLLGALSITGLLACPVSGDGSGLASASPQVSPDDPEGAAPSRPDPLRSFHGPRFMFTGLTALFLDGEGALQVTIRGSASAGDEWSYAVEPEGVLLQTTAAYSSDAPSASGEGLAQGLYTWVFEGVGEGDALLTFTYSGLDGRDGEVRPEVYGVRVDAEGKIALVKRIVPRPPRPSRPMGGMVR